MATIITILGAAILWLLSMFGVHKLGKNKGMDLQKTEDEKKAAEQQNEKLVNEIKARKESDAISQKINTEIDSAKSGDSLDWLRKNANRDSNDK